MIYAVAIAIAISIGIGTESLTIVRPYSLLRRILHLFTGCFVLFAYIVRRRLRPSTPRTFTLRASFVIST